MQIVIGDSGFNPRSRMGSDHGRHSAVRSDGQFQPTLPHGERRCAIDGRLLDACFNPRSRMGSDRGADPVAAITDRVSTHAPAWGATRTGSRAGRRQGCFNPRSRMGSDMRTWPVKSEAWVAHPGFRGAIRRPINDPNSALPRFRTLCTNSKNPRYNGSLSCDIPRWGRSHDRNSDQNPSTVLT